MLTLQIGGRDVSAACLGTAEFGGKYDEAFSISQLDLFRDYGGNFIDTAHVYNDWHPGEKSRSEKLIGRWMEHAGRREDFFLSTKGGHPPLTDMSHSRISRREIAADLEESLSFLRTSYVDLYFLHRDCTDVPVGEIVDWMNEWIREGKIRHWGCSNWTLNRIRAANEYARHHDLEGITCNQAMWSYAVFRQENLPDQTLVPADSLALHYHAQTALPLMAFTAQARGYLARLASGEPIPPDVQAAFGCSENARRLRTLQKMQKETGLSISQLCLLYFLSLPFPAFPIVSFHSHEQLADSLELYNHKGALLPLAYRLFSPSL